MMIVILLQVWPSLNILTIKRIQSLTLSKIFQRSVPLELVEAEQDFNLKSMFALNLWFQQRALHVKPLYGDQLVESTSGGNIKRRSAKDFLFWLAKWPSDTIVRQICITHRQHSTTTKMFWKIEALYVTLLFWVMATWTIKLPESIWVNFKGLFWLNRRLPTVTSNFFATD